jgi:hypothetical protein
LRRMYPEVSILEYHQRDSTVQKVVRILSQPQLHNIFTGSALKCSKIGQKQLNMTHNRNNTCQT